MIREYKSKIIKNGDFIDIPLTPTLELRNVGFKYSGAKNTVLNNINLKISSGDKIAFVGENGAGKTTLVKLITYLYKPTYGELLINDIEYNKYDVYSLRNAIGTVFQDYQIFALTIAENILMRPIINKLEDEEIVINALKFVKLYDKVNRLPKGIYNILQRFKKT